MRFIRLLIPNSFRNTLRFCSTQTKNVVTVVSQPDDEVQKIKLSFSYPRSLSTIAPLDQKVSSVLSTVKLKYALLQKRGEIRRAIENKYFGTAHAAVETDEDYYEDVQLFVNNELIDENTPNIDAWSQASVLKIGDISYEVQFNAPGIKNMSLPDYILCGCYLRPHFQLDCYTTFKDCIFTWYRSVNNNVDSKNNKMTDWVKVGEDFNYLVTSEDIGCYLKLVCSPREGDRIGSDYAAVSKNTVEAAPERFPFEERQVYTKPIFDSSRFRCVSYNTLADIYVERRKFPYASNKARDNYYRRQLVTKELIGYNSDIICLQEVQERVFHYDFLPVLQKAGFSGFYAKKGGKRNEGLATFFRPSKFKAVFNQNVLLNEIIKDKGIFASLLNDLQIYLQVYGNNKTMSKLLAQDTALQVVLLENIEDPINKILIANTHLYSNKDEPIVRLIQAAVCVNYIEHLIKTELTDSPGIVFCGDFNSLPDSEAFKFVTSGNFDFGPPSCVTNTKANGDTTFRHNLSLESACGIPTYTNYTEEFHGCLDYIFYSKNTLEVTDIVPMPKHEIVTAQVGLPSEYFPSDHIALVCTVKWKNKDI